MDPTALRTREGRILRKTLTSVDCDEPFSTKKVVSHLTEFSTQGDLGSVGPFRIGV